MCYGLAAKQARYNGRTDAPKGEESAGENAETALPETVLSVGGKEYMLQQVMALPFSESQVLFLRYCKNLKPGDIAYLMEIPRSAVKRYLRSGIRRLQKLLTR